MRRGHSRAAGARYTLLVAAALLLFLLLFSFVSDFDTIRRLGTHYGRAAVWSQLDVLQTLPTNSSSLTAHPRVIAAHQEALIATDRSRTPDLSAPLLTTDSQAGGATLLLLEE